MAITGINATPAPWDKGLVLELLGPAIGTSFTFSEVVPDGTSPVKFPPMQYSGQARHLALYVYAKTTAGSPITTVIVDVEVCHEDPTNPVNWAKVLSKVHGGGGTTNVNSSLVLGAAPIEGTVLVTCDEFSLAKHVRVGGSADHQGQAGDILRIFAVAW
jgi:hypothetical protein